MMKFYKSRWKAAQSQCDELKEALAADEQESAVKKKYLVRW